MAFVGTNNPVTLTEYIDSVTGKIKPQYMKTIKETFNRSLTDQTFLKQAKRIPVERYMGNTIKQQRFDKFKATTLPIVNKYSDGLTQNQQRISSRLIELEWWRYGSFVEWTRWLEETGDSQLAPIVLNNVRENAVESFEAMTREFLRDGAKVFSTATAFTYAGCPCSVWSGTTGSVTNGDLTGTATNGTGLPTFDMFNAMQRELKLFGAKNVRVYLSQYCADYLRADTGWRDAMLHAYSGKGTSPILTGNIEVPYQGVTYVVMQDYITEDVSENSTPKIVEDLFVMCDDVLNVADMSGRFDINIITDSTKNVADPYNFIKSVSWQGDFGASIVDNSKIYKVKVMYPGMPTAETVFDQLNVA